ncbi:MAG TPA: hypothetical protein VMM93_09875 [Vicinamibacterales bacterium]|nr:hypothetical protein [Vicinamibacterales bacterium]
MIAILGAGELGGAIAERLMIAGRVGHVRLVDEAAGVATGKALDIAQAGSVVRSDVRLTAASDPLAASTADVVVIADAVEGGEFLDERGIALVETLVRSGSSAAFVFAGPNQTSLLELAASRLGVGGDRLVGTAASAVAGTVRSLTAAEVDGSGVDVSVALAGRPPQLVVAWSAATIAGAPAAERIPAHRLLAISATATRLWPPGPAAIAAATAPVAAALAGRSRRRYQAMAMAEVDGRPKPYATMQSLVLGHGRILRREAPVLTPAERIHASSAD